MEELPSRSQENEINMFKCLPVSQQAGEDESVPVLSTRTPRTSGWPPAGPAAPKYPSGPRPKFGLTAVILSFGNEESKRLLEAQVLIAKTRISSREIGQ